MATQILNNAATSPESHLATFTIWAKQGSAAQLAGNIPQATLNYHQAISAKRSYFLANQPDYQKVNLVAADNTTRGKILTMQGNFSGARAAFDAAMQENPNELVPWLNLAHFLVTQNDHPAALDLLEAKAAERYSSDAYVLLAKLYLDKNMAEHSHAAMNRVYSPYLSTGDIDSLHISKDPHDWPWRIRHDFFDLLIERTSSTWQLKDKTPLHPLINMIKADTSFIFFMAMILYPTQDIARALTNLPEQKAGNFLRTWNMFNMFERAAMINALRFLNPAERARIRTLIGNIDPTLLAYLTFEIK